MSVSSRLEDLGLVLPELSAPVGSYVPATQVGRLIMTSGQLPVIKGEVIAQGKVPQDVSLSEAQEAARIAVINGLAAAAYQAGGIDRIERIVRVGVFVNSGSPDQVKSLVNLYQADYPVWVYPDASIGDVIDSHLVPTYLYVNADGGVEEMLVGMKTQEEVTRFITGHMTQETQGE